MVVTKKCVFCKIIKREMTAKVIWEDKDFIAIKDRSQVVEGHTLVITKDCVLNFLQAKPKHLKGLIGFVKKVVSELKKDLKIDGMTLLANNYYGQTIPHMHWHILPRKTNDKGSFSSKTTREKKELYEHTKKKMQKEIKGWT